jgi:hypothetical protein
MEGFCLMPQWNRREFLSHSLAAGAALSIELPATSGFSATQERQEVNAQTAIDFRYSPLRYQSTFCFPDDPVKSLVDSEGSLLYDFPDDHLAPVHQFGTIVSFLLAGMKPQQQFRQWLEAPGVPIIYTHVEQSAAVFQLTIFATHRESEGRVDNVLMEVTPKQETMYAAPRIAILSCRKYDLAQKTGRVTTVVRDGAPFMYCIP